MVVRPAPPAGSNSRVGRLARVSGSLAAGRDQAVLDRQERAERAAAEYGVAIRLDLPRQAGSRPIPVGAACPQPGLALRSAPSAERARRGALDAHGYRWSLPARKAS